MHIDLEQYSTEYTVGKNVISISSKNLHFSKGVNPLLINSSNLQVLCQIYTEKTKRNGHNSGGSEALKYRGKGTRREQERSHHGGGGVTRSTGTGGSHPGLESRSQRHRTQIG